MKVVLLAVRNSLLIDQCDAMHWTGHFRDDYSSRSLWTRSSLAVEPVDQRVDVGAKLGAIPCGLRRTGLDICGRRLEIYGSGGCVFESRRAR